MKQEYIYLPVRVSLDKAHLIDQVVERFMGNPARGRERFLRAAMEFMLVALWEDLDLRMWIPRREPSIDIGI